MPITYDTYAVGLCHDSGVFSLGDVIRKLREQRDWTLDDMHDKSGVNRQSISEIERGIVDPRKSTLDRLAQALGYADIAALELDSRQPEPSDRSRHTGTGQPVIAEDEAEEFDRDISRGYKKHDVPVIGDAEASTNGFIAWDDEGLVRAEITEWVSRSFADGDPRAYALRVRGDSMVPRYFPGEVIVAQPREICRDGDYAVAILKSGERLVKRVFRNAGGWLLHSENSLYPDRQVLDDEILMLHRIRHSIAAR